MSGVLLDTTVISELTRPVPAAAVVGFLAETDDLWLFAFVLHELEFGLLLLPSGGRRDTLRDALSEVTRRYDDRILPVGRRAAGQAARLRAKARREGRNLDLGDALIAGTASAHGLSVATRNVADFEGLGLGVTNPWDFPLTDSEPGPGSFGPGA